MIGIHNRNESFSTRWLHTCEDRGLPHISINMFGDGFIRELFQKQVSVFLCHPAMADRRSGIATQSILRACSAAGIRVFPSLNDYWHFDDKIAQRYLFDSLRITTPATHVFFDEAAALEWIEQAVFPVVFKLRSGAGSINVSLIKTKQDAILRTRRMFRRGYAGTDALFKDLSTKVRLHNSRRDWIGVARRLPRTALNWLELRRSIDWERGYVYFQEFVPGNQYDVRVTVIGERAFAFRRRVRPGDFRASGSGLIDYDQKSIDPACIGMAFNAAQRIGTSCIAFDFVQRASDGTHLIIEMSFGFKPDAVYDCPGYWTPDLDWRAGHFWPQDAILEDMIRGVTF